MATPINLPRSARAWNFNIDFVGRMRPILWTSLVTSIMSVAAVMIWGLNFGTDFAGGYEIQVHFPKTVTESQIRDVLGPMHLGDARVQRFGSDSDNDYLILVREMHGAMTPDVRHKIAEALKALAKTEQDISQLSIAESGESINVDYGTPVSTESVSGALQQLDIKVKDIQISDNKEAPHFMVTLYSLADDIAHTLRAGLNLKDSDALLERVEFVGPQVGAQLRTQGIMAVIYSLGLILLYVAVRFDMFFAPGAIIATLHDVIITLGVFSALQVDFNLTVVAAILTLIGFSLNDTIVVYDRIRENVGRLRGKPLRELVNISINETLSRTILTSGTVVLVTASLLFLGGPFLRGFSIAMFVGVIVGTYSSIAVASPLYIALREFRTKPKVRLKRPVKSGRLPIDAAPQKKIQRQANG